MAHSDSPLMSVNGMPTDAPGILTFTHSAPNPGRPVSFTSRIFDDPSGPDKYMADVQNSSVERKIQVDEINAKCVSIRLRIVRVIKEGKYVGANPPIIMMRNFIRAKRACLDEVTNLLAATIDNAPDDRTKPTLNSSTTGQQGLLTLSGPMKVWLLQRRPMNDSNLPRENPQGNVCLTSQKAVPVFLFLFLVILSKCKRSSCPDWLTRHYTIGFVLVFNRDTFLYWGRDCE